MAKPPQKSEKMQGCEQFVTFGERIEKIKKGLEKECKIVYNVILDNEDAQASLERDRKDIV
jgi:hypothetical protein